MVFGYINALDLESQNLQAKQLDRFGVDKWFSEQVNGKINRSALDSLVERMRKGDKLVLCSLFNLPLTALQAIEFLMLLKREEIEFVSISEKIDQDTIAHLNVLHKSTIRERAKGNLGDSKSKRGRKKGEISQRNKEKGMAAAHLYKTKYLKGEITIPELMKLSQIKSKSTLYIRLRENDIDPHLIKQKNNK